MGFLKWVKTQTTESGIEWKHGVTAFANRKQRMSVSYQPTRGNFNCNSHIWKPKKSVFGFFGGTGVKRKANPVDLPEGIFFPGVRVPSSCAMPFMVEHWAMPKGSWAFRHACAWIFSHLNSMGGLDVTQGVQVHIPCKQMLPLSYLQSNGRFNAEQLLPCGFYTGKFAQGAGFHRGGALPWGHRTQSVILSLRHCFLFSVWQRYSGGMVADALVIIVKFPFWCIGISYIKFTQLRLHPNENIQIWLVQPAKKGSIF